MSEFRPRFNLAQQLQELRSLADWAKLRLDSPSYVRIDEVCDNFEAFLGSTSMDPYTLTVPLAKPIQTRPTKSYEPSSKKGLLLTGCLSFRVELHPIRMGKVRSHFELGGETTYYIKLKDSTQAERAVWHFDVASPDSPGALAHAQISGVAPVPVPRLPSLCLLPSDALEFLFAEMFHAEWSDLSSGEKYRRFANKQRPRVARILFEQHRVLATSSNESAWAALRGWRPLSILDFST